MPKHGKNSRAKFITQADFPNLIRAGETGFETPIVIDPDDPLPEDFLLDVNGAFILDTDSAFILAAD